MPALSKHGGGEEDTERPECVHSSAIQTDLKPTGAGAFSPQLCFSLVGPLPLLPPMNLFHCKSASLFSYLFLYLFLQSVFHIRLTDPVFLSGTQTLREAEAKSKADVCSCHKDYCVQKGSTQGHNTRPPLLMFAAFLYFRAQQMTMVRNLESVFFMMKRFHETDTVARSYYSN